MFRMCACRCNGHFIALYIILGRDALKSGKRVRARRVVHRFGAEQVADVVVGIHSFVSHTLTRLEQYTLFLHFFPFNHFTLVSVETILGASCMTL